MKHDPRTGTHSGIDADGGRCWPGLRVRSGRACRPGLRRGHIRSLDSRLAGSAGRVITLERFEDYLLRPAREGLGIPSLLWLSKVLDAHEDLVEREAAFAAVRQEIPDFDARVEKERAKAAVRMAEAAKKQGGTGANQHTVKDNSRVDNINSAKPRKKGGTDPEYIIARLKRDAADNPQAPALLDTLSAGDISARRQLQSYPDSVPDTPLFAVTR